MTSKHSIDMTIFDKCHHNTIQGCVDIRVLLSPSYTCKVWNYSKLNFKAIKQAIFDFD